MVDQKNSSQDTGGNVKMYTKNRNSGFYQKNVIPLPFTIFNSRYETLSAQINVMLI